MTITHFCAFVMCGALQISRSCCCNKSLFNGHFYCSIDLFQLTHTHTYIYIREQYCICVRTCVRACVLGRADKLLVLFHTLTLCLFVCLFVSLGVRGKPRVYCSLLAYCTARFGRSNFGLQMRPAPADAFRTLAAEVGTYGRGIGPGIFPKCRLPRYI
jgi:hypothetical protein